MEPGITEVLPTINGRCLNNKATNQFDTIVYQPLPRLTNMKTDRIFVLLLVVMLPMSGCFDDAVGDAEGAEDSGTTVNYHNNTTVINHHYHNNTTNIIQDSPTPQVLYVANGTTGYINTSSGQIVEVLDAWSSISATTVSDSISNAIQGHFSCSNLPYTYTANYVGNYHTYGDGATDWLPTDGTECTYSFGSSLTAGGDIFIIYKIHN